jgi:hypothetical protein
MAKLGQGLLGNASGKLGTVVFAKNRKTNTVRKHQPVIQDKKSPAQLTQRQAIKTITAALSPLKNTFISFFNQTTNNKQTPWDKAIKDNISALDVNGSFDLSKLQLGFPVFPAPSIKSSIYNPFIDQIWINFKDNSSISDPSKILFSFFGRLKSVDNTFVYNTQNLIQSNHFYWAMCGTQTGEDTFEISWNLFWDGYCIAWYNL